MVWYDFVILALLIYFGWKGASRGLITQSAWIIALVLCFKLSGKLAPSIEPHIPVDEELRPWAAMFVLYLGFCIATFIGTRIIKDWVDKAKLGDLDRHLGAIFGLIIGILVYLVVTFFAVSWSGTRDAVLSSFSGRNVAVILDKADPILPLFPEWFSGRVSVWIDEYERKLHPTNDHLGQETGPGDVIGSDPLFPDSNNTSGNGSGLDFPDLFGNQGNDTPNNSTGSLFDSLSDASIQAAINQLPRSIREQWGDQILQQWRSATPEQKRNLVKDLSTAFPDEVSGIVSRFLGTQTGQGSGIDPQLLNRIGDIYGNRESIVQRAMQHLNGIPPNVQKAVLDDWYADLTLETTDPDPSTDINTRIDERILRQLSKANISLNSLASSLQERLRQSLR
jgi:membrane protein required for colicin V production